MVGDDGDTKESLAQGQEALLLLQWDASTVEPIGLGRRQVEERSQGSPELAVRLVIHPLQSLEVLYDVVLADVAVEDFLAIASQTSPSLADLVSLGWRQVQSLSRQILFPYTKGEKEVPLAAEDVGASRVVKQAKTHIYGRERLAELLVPDAGRLLESVERLLQTDDLPCVLGTLGCDHVDLRVALAIKGRSLHVEVAEPLLSCGPDSLGQEEESFYRDQSAGCVLTASAVSHFRATQRVAKPCAASCTT